MYNSVAVVYFHSLSACNLCQSCYIPSTCLRIPCMPNESYIYGILYYFLPLSFTATILCFLFQSYTYSCCLFWNNTLRLLMGGDNGVLYNILNYSQFHVFIALVQCPLLISLRHVSTMTFNPYISSVSYPVVSIMFLFY